jgi:hypothetical protein
MTEQVSSDISVPSAENIDKAVEEYEPIPRNYVDEPDNLAEETELVQKYTAALTTFYNRFIGQAERHDLDTYLKNADAKWRMACDVQNQYGTNSSQKQNTLSHVASEQFYNSIKLIWSGMTSIIFGDGEDKPARYDPIEGSNDYVPVEGKRITDEQSAYFNAVYDIEKWDAKIKESIRTGSGLLHQEEGA